MGYIAAITSTLLRPQKSDAGRKVWLMFLAVVPRKRNDNDNDKGKGHSAHNFFQSFTTLLLQRREKSDEEKVIATFLDYYGREMPRAPNILATALDLTCNVLYCHRMF